MDCVAIDFETASSHSSPCAVGVAVVKGGVVSYTFYTLIKPQDDYFAPYNFKKHGITPEDVADQPEFPVVWEELKPLLESGLVIAHSAGFDMSVLRQTLELYGLPFPSFDYTCSLMISKKVWPKPILPNHELDTVAKHLDIELEHHNALSDAKASGLIGCQACKKKDADTFDILADKLGIRHKRFMANGYSPASGASRASGGSSRIDVKKSTRTAVNLKELTPTTEDFDEEHPFFEKIFAFTGTLQSMRKADAKQQVRDVGGQVVRKKVTNKTNFLVVGQPPDGILKTDQHLKAEKLKAEGRDIELLSEEEFFQILETAER